MTREQTVHQIREGRVSAILRTDDTERARSAMEAAVAGGFRIIEFTLSIPNALELVSDFVRDERLLVGVGTVLTEDQVNASKEAGARFVVSPVFNPDVIREARRIDLASIPGTYSPTEMLAAHEAGADFCKLFPAPGDVASYVSSVLGPLPMLQVFPTNGVDEHNFVEVLESGAAGVGFVKSLFPPEELAAGDYASIKSRASRIHEQLARMKHAT